MQLISGADRSTTPMSEINRGIILTALQFDQLNIYFLRCGKYQLMVIVCSEA
jgi:hypothetical protein